MTDVAHPLTIDILKTAAGGRFLLVGIGGGRNLLPFKAAGLAGFAIDENHARVAKFARLDARIKCCVAPYTRMPINNAACELILATHVLQHGTESQIRATIAEIARVCAPGGRFYGVFASRRDARYGHGTFIETDCYAPSEGAEKGVAHYYCDEAYIASVLKDTFSIIELHEVVADAFVGSWAHAEPQGLVHYFVKAVRHA